MRPSYRSIHTVPLVSGPTREGLQQGVIFKSEMIQHEMAVLSTGSGA